MNYWGASGGLGFEFWGWRGAAPFWAYYNKFKGGRACAIFFFDAAFYN